MVGGERMTTEYSDGRNDNEIVTAFQPLARIIAVRMSRRIGRRMSIDDLAQVALMAVVPAFRQFNPDRGTTLASWIGTKMRFAVASAVRSEMQRRVVGRADVEIFSLDNRIRFADGSTLGDLGPHLQHNPWPAIEAAIDADLLSHGISKRNRDIAIRRAGGDELVAIGLDHGVKGPRVYQIYDEVVKRMRAAA
jgi:DNA-directed RNA polymerase specialized sigma24 family protein